MFHVIINNEPAVYSDWTVLPKLFLSLMDLTNKVDESISGFWNALFGPIGELKLPYCSRRTVSGISHFEFS